MGKPVNPGLPGNGC